MVYTHQLIHLGKTRLFPYLETYISFPRSICVGAQNTGLTWDGRWEGSIRNEMAFAVTDNILENLILPIPLILQMPRQSQKLTEGRSSQAGRTQLNLMPSDQKAPQWNCLLLPSAISPSPLKITTINSHPSGVPLKVSALNGRLKMVQAFLDWFLLIACEELEYDMGTLWVNKLIGMNVWGVWGALLSSCYLMWQRFFAWPNLTQPPEPSPRPICALPFEIWF